MLNQKFADGPGGARDQRVAAAGARHRHDRRLQDGDPGHPRRRSRPARGRGESGGGAANQTPGLTSVFTTFNTRTPKIWADIDRVRAEMLGVRTDDVSPRSKSISARNMSTISTSSAAPTG